MATGEFNLRGKIVEYILAWTPVDLRAASPREAELDLLHDALRELNSNIDLLKHMKRKAAIWQAKYSDCKTEITILRQRKTYYKNALKRYVI